MRPHLVRWHKEFADSGLVIIEIDGDPDRYKPLIESSIKKQDVVYPVLWDRGRKLERIYGIKRYPAAYLVAPSGKVIWEGDLKMALRRPKLATKIRNLMVSSLASVLKTSQPSGTKPQLDTGDDSSH